MVDSISGDGTMGMKGETNMKPALFMIVHSDLYNLLCLLVHSPFGYFGFDFRSNRTNSYVLTPPVLPHNPTDIPGWAS